MRSSHFLNHLRCLLYYHRIIPFRKEWRIMKKYERNIFFETSSLQKFLFQRQSFCSLTGFIHFYFMEHSLCHFTFMGTTIFLFAILSCFYFGIFFSSKEEYGEEEKRLFDGKRFKK